MSLPSPMIGNSTGVKANNSFVGVDKLFFHLIMLNLCDGTKNWQFYPGQ
jgi:hypothetical protein